MLYLLTVSVAAYTSALTSVTTAIGGAVPTVAVAAGAIGAGLIVFGIGFRAIKRFAKG